ncbi:MAG: YqeG family HAD IIIA-type phosphatase [Dehalococcoidia bacterium]|nr:YqeG family HAD IIIA-type phosphatase [Dehalococcoidia bacterium]
MLILDHLIPRRSECRPDHRFNSIADIDARVLYDLGVRAVGFDADQTLCAFHGTDVNERLLASIESMRDLFSGQMCIISNCTDKRRAELIEHFPFYVIQNSEKKPSVEPYREAERHFGVPAEQWAFVGDRLATDIVGANRAGWRSILVSPLVPETDPWYIALARSYERLLWRVYRM